MKPSNGIQYVLRALVDLALHQHRGPVPVATIAKRQGIPAQYLEQLFNRLRRQGIVTAERGPRGGYRLGRSPKEIPVSDIFACLENSKGAVSSSDPAASVWRQVEAAVQTTLEATTLEVLVAQAREKAPALFDHRFTFHI